MPNCRALSFIVVVVLFGTCANASADSFFVDPSHYDLYNCDQLNKARKTTATHVAELQGLMAKAETGFAGVLMSGLAYQSEYVAARGELEQIDLKREQNKCGPLPPDKPGEIPAVTQSEHPHSKKKR